MKVIDLLNKIANGEEVPIHFICNGHSYTIVEYPVCGKKIINYKDEENDYLFGSEYELGLILNNKIEIIEEDKEIEDTRYMRHFESSGKCYIESKQHKYYVPYDLLLLIDDLVKAVNELKKGK